MCYFTRTVYTICAHHVDTPKLPCKGVSLRRRLGFTTRPVKPCCHPANDGRAFIKLGWCPDCEFYLDHADFLGHRTEIRKDNWAFISNFWAWRSWHDQSAIAKVSAKHYPLAAINQPLEAIEYRRSRNAINGPYRTYAHALLTRKQHAEWHDRNRSSLFETVSPNASPAPQVPGLSQLTVHHPENELHEEEMREDASYISFESYAVWWKLYEFQPTMIIPDEQAVKCGAQPAATLMDAELLMAKLRCLTFAGYSDKCSAASADDDSYLHGCERRLH